MITLLQVITASPTLLVLLISFPPFGSTGNFTVSLRLNSSLAARNIDLADDSASFPVSAIVAPPVILSTTPSQATVGTAAIVDLHVSPFPLPARGAVVSFGETGTSLVADPKSDGRGGAFLSVWLPSGAPAGRTEVTVIYELYAAGVTQDIGLPLLSKLTARKPFLCNSNGIVVQCVKGCELYTSTAVGEYQVVQVMITADQASQLPDPNRIIVACEAQLDGRAAGESSDCSAASIATTTAPCCASTNSGSVCLCIDIQIAVLVAAVVSSTRTTGFITITESSKSEAIQLVAAVVFRRPPRLIAATFTASYGRIVLSFDADTAAASLPCAALVRAIDNPESSLGVSPVCTWATPAQLEVSLGSGATISPGDRLEASLAALDPPSTVTITRAADRLAETVSVSAPERPQLPRLVIAGPAEVGACDVAELTVSASASPGATFEWGCADDYRLNAFLLNASAGSAGTVSVPGAILDPGRTYLVSVRARPRFGSLSGQALHSLALSARAGPQLAIALPPPPLARSRRLLIEANLMLSACTPPPSVRPVYNWAIVPKSGSGPAGSNLLRGNGPAFMVPAGLLTVGVRYAVTLVAIFPSGSAPAQAAAEISLDSEPIAARIMGGDRAMGMMGSVTVDASSSFDPDVCTYTDDPATGERSCTAGAIASNEGLTFEWECAADGMPCRSATNGSVAQFGTSSVATVNPALFVPPLVEGMKLRMMVTVRRRSGIGTAAKASVTLSVAAGTVIDVSISQLYATVERAAYTAVLPASFANIAQLNFAWTVEALVPVPQDAFLAGTSGRSLVIRLGPFARAASPPVYRFILRVTAPSGAIGIAVTTLQTPARPSGGVCGANPSVGVLLQTRFIIRCSDWAADNLPLTYSFAALPEGKSAVEATGLTDSSTSWSPPAPVSAFSMWLFAAGNYTLAVTVIDAIGASTAVYCAWPQGGRVLVKAAAGESSSGPGQKTAVLGSLVDQLLLQGSVGPGLSLLDGVAASINSASAATCSSSGTNGGGAACRRLLASSQAYRMAVRKLLLRKLSGIASIAGVTTSAPALLRAARRATAAPAELGSGGPEAGAAALESALASMGISALRSGGLSDAAVMAASMLKAAAGTNDAVALAALACSAVGAVLGALAKYANGMLVGEAQLETRTNGGDLTALAARGGPLVSVPGASVGWDETTAAKRRNFASAPAGICVVRLSSWLGLPTPVLPSGNGTTVAQPFAEIVGVMAVPSDGSLIANGTASVAWTCPPEQPRCVHVAVAVQWRGTGSRPFSATYVCLLWRGGRWNSTGCSFTSGTWVPETNGTGAAALVNCSCDADGVVTVSVATVSATRFDTAPIYSTVFVQPHAIEPTILVCVVVVTLGITTASLVMMVLRVVCRSEGRHKGTMGSLHLLFTANDDPLSFTKLNVKSNSSRNITCPSSESPDFAGQVRVSPTLSPINQKEKKVEDIWMSADLVFLTSGDGKNPQCCPAPDREILCSSYRPAPDSASSDFPLAIMTAVNTEVAAVETEESLRSQRRESNKCASIRCWQGGNWGVRGASVLQTIDSESSGSSEQRSPSPKAQLDPDIEPFQSVGCLREGSDSVIPTDPQLFLAAGAGPDQLQPMLNSVCEPSAPPSSPTFISQQLQSHVLPQTQQTPVNALDDGFDSFTGFADSVPLPAGVYRRAISPLNFSALKTGAEVFSSSPRRSLHTDGMLRDSTMAGRESHISAPHSAEDYLDEARLPCTPPVQVLTESPPPSGDATAIPSYAESSQSNASSSGLGLLFPQHDRNRQLLLTLSAECADLMTEGTDELRRGMEKKSNPVRQDARWV